MRKQLLIFLLAFCLKGFSQITSIGQTNVTCNATCNGTRSYTVTGSAFPYTVMSVSGCTFNPIIVTTSSFVIQNLCACNYGVAFFDNGNNFIGSDNFFISQ